VIFRAVVTIAAFFRERKPTMHRYLALAAAALALSLAGCAGSPATTSTAQKPMEAKEYRVGSRIPLRDPVSASPTTSVDGSAVRSGAN